MRSLSTRLALAFALTSLVGIGLAAFFVRQFVTSQFDDFVLEQRRNEFVALLANYYVNHDGWDAIPPEALFRMGERRDPDHFDAGVRSTFGLADLDGRLILGPNPLERGRQASAAELASGVPVMVAGVQVGTVFATGGLPGRNPAEERYLARTDLALAAAALVAVLASMALGLLLARLITRPVRDLTDAARLIAEGELGRQVQVRSRDELGSLARQFNAMSADLQRANDLRRRMTADIAHDLRTPLTVIAGYLEAMGDASLAPTPARFTAMHDETQVLLRLVEDLHTLSLADAGELALRPQPTDPAALLSRVVQTYHDAAAQAGVTLCVETSQTLPTPDLDGEQIVRVLGNLVNNALRYTPPGGQISLTAHREAATLVLRVSNPGPGIPAEHLPNLFERFYRADEARQQATGGSGLGLAIVRSIVSAHGGHVTVASELGVGTTFTVRLPV